MARRILDSIGSLAVAVPLLLAIAGVLGWGTIYESRFGTAAVQRAMYQSWWFQALLAFLAVNLAVAALRRYPWQRRHAPFVLAHIGIILILFGGVIGGRFGIEGQLVIPEGTTERVLRLPANGLAVRQRNPGVDHFIPTRFEASAWIHEPNAAFQVPLEDRPIQLIVDRYYPNAAVEEEIADGGDTENPAVRLVMRRGEHEEGVWLFARDPQRFAAASQEAHALFLDLPTDAQRQRLLQATPAAPSERGSILLEFPARGLAREIPVSAKFGRPIAVKGTPYRITFKDYFPDFAITEQGPVSRSNQPNNPAVSFTVSGPEGADAHLLFAFHPDFPALHGRTQMIPVRLRYAHPAQAVLPPQAIAIIRDGSVGLAAVLTGSRGEREVIDPLAVGRSYAHPWLGQPFEVADYFTHATVLRRFINRSNDVKAEALHITVRDGERTGEAWLALEQPVELLMGKDAVVVEYRPARRELPFAIKLLDFRKIDYPGTQMAAAFESDVELTDPQRGIILMRKISMNNPLRYRGFSFFQSSYIPGPPETTVLSVRSDPGTPFVYAGFAIVIAGIISLFVLRDPSERQ